MAPDLRPASPTATMNSLITQKTVERFWLKVAKSNNPEGCWNWTACLINQGYGRLYSKNTVLLAHRVSFFLHFGEFDSTLYVCHKCDNRRCVNPDHLFLGTAKDNAVDMVNKGRLVIPIQRGERVYSAKLTESSVLMARARNLAGESQYSIAADLGVSQPSISSAITKRTWKHII